MCNTLQSFGFTRQAAMSHLLRHYKIETYKGYFISSIKGAFWNLYWGHIGLYYFFNLWAGIAQYWCPKFEKLRLGTSTVKFQFLGGDLEFHSTQSHSSYADTNWAWLLWNSKWPPRVWNFTVICPNMLTGVTRWIFNW